MLVSSQSPPVPLYMMSCHDSNSVRSHQTNTSTIIPPTLIPKHFNVTFAIQHGYFRCVRYLLELCYDPNERDSQLRTPLILCSYIENNRWGLSIAQNLLEKGAKIALEDHARRNAMHHACALQRIHLVQLYLSCLDFNLQSKDCEGNTCLHYVAITGNCEIAELLIQSAEKIGIRLDQYINREGCSAAVLALKYGHIECANQITHRDWDEFFVVPRPLSIYETPPTPDDNHPFKTTTTIPTSKKKHKTNSSNLSTTKNDIHPSTLSFGLLKIIFNESDSSYSTRLAKLCNDKKQLHHHQRIRHKKQNIPQLINQIDPKRSSNTHYSSTDALVNEFQISTIDDEHKINLEDNEEINNIGRISPRMGLFMKQHLSKENILFSNNENKTKINQQASNSTLNYIEPTISVLYESPRTKNKLQRPKTAIISRNQTSVNAVGAPSRLSSPSRPTSSSHKKSKKLLNTRPYSASVIPKQQHSNFTSESPIYSQTLYAGRPLSAVLQSHHHRHLPIQRTVDATCAIREAKGVASRYNKPEKLFGLKPEELFGSTEDHQPKMIDHYKITDKTQSKHNNLQKQKYIWQQDVDKLVDLYNIHHSSNYRPPAIPPRTTGQGDTNDTVHIGRPLRTPLSRCSRSPTNPKQSTLASLNIPRRSSVSQRPSIKLTNV